MSFAWRPTLDPPPCFYQHRVMLAGGLQYGRHDLLYAETVNKRGFTRPAAMNRFYEFKILVVPEPLPWIGAGLAWRSLNFLELNRNRDTTIIAALPCDEHLKRVRELVRHGTLAAV